MPRMLIAQNCRLCMSVFCTISYYVLNKSEKENKRTKEKKKLYPAVRVLQCKLLLPPQCSNREKYKNQHGTCSCMWFWTLKLRQTSNAFGPYMDCYFQ